MEILLDTISPERQERLLNPQMSDHFKTFMCGKYGYRLYTIKIGRKWVMLRSNNHRARITLDKYKQCLKKFASTQNKNDNAACNSYEKKLNNIIDHDMVLLKNNISKDINNMNSNVHQFVKNIDKSKKKYTFYNEKKKQFATEEELASDPHRYELFQLPKAKWEAIDAIIVVNKRMKELLEEKLPQMEGKIHCIPNYLDTAYWTPKENRTKTNQIAIVGTVEPRKGHDKAIVAFSKIVKKNPDLRLNIIGVNNDKEFSKTLRRLAEDLKLRNKIRFLGFSEDIKKDFQDSDIIVSFSEHESTHLTLFEGLSCGAWPLSTTWDGVEEFLPDENLFNDDKEFVKKVKKFLNLHIQQWEFS